MLDPTLALQEAVKAVLLTSPTIAAHVATGSIRAGSVRDDEMPAIVLAPAQIEILGHAAGGQLVAELRLILSLWCADNDTARAQAIASAMMLALMDAPKIAGAQVDEWHRPVLAWYSDPNPARSFTHAAVALRAVLRWRQD